MCAVAAVSGYRKDSSNSSILKNVRFLVVIVIAAVVNGRSCRSERDVYYRYPHPPQNEP